MVIGKPPNSVKNLYLSFYITGIAQHQTKH